MTGSGSLAHSKTPYTRTFASMDANSLNSLQQQVLVNIINFCFLFRENQHLQSTQAYIYTLTPHPHTITPSHPCTTHTHSWYSIACTHWGWGLLQALEQVHHPCLLLDVLHLLDDVQAGSASTTHIHCHRVDKGTPGKALDLLWHGCTEQQGLPLALIEGWKGREGEGRGGEGRVLMILTYCHRWHSP